MDEKSSAYRALAKHIYRAHRMYEGSKTLIILADNEAEAEAKARKALDIENLKIFVARVIPTEDPQVYEV